MIGILGIVTGPLSADGPYSSYQAAHWVNLGSAAVVNYDQVSNQAPFNSSNVDWTVNLAFYNNAEVDKVKQILPSPFHYEGNTMYGQVHEGSNFYTDADSGVKNNVGSCPVDIHMRLYARPSVDRNYSTGWGYVVWATSHHDVYEPCSYRWYGDSEWAEHQFGTEYINKGYAVCRDCWGYDNYEPIRQVGSSPHPNDHHWDNNGWTTAISIP